MNEGARSGCKLTLISAPAGFGKTTLVSEWLAGCERPAAWLSLDEGDSDPTRFLAYLVAALQTSAPTLGEEALTLLQSPQPPPTESVLTVLLNAITAIPETFVLVLDDYLVIDAEPVNEVLIFLLERLPPQMHLVITDVLAVAVITPPLSTPAPRKAVLSTTVVLESTSVPSL